MLYIKVSQAAENWGISPRRVRLLCAENRIDGVIRRGNLFMIPENTPKPADGRSLKRKSFPGEFSALFMSIEAKKTELNKRLPLTKGELIRLNEEFLIEFTYNSNAILYYAAFDSYFPDHDAAPMIKLIADYTDERLIKYLSMIK